MVCEAILDKVNYCMLDAKNIFLDLELKQLELIECGRVSHSERVVPSTFRFLFLLSRLKDKKLISIPKIINLCDNLLANRSVVPSGTLALKELAVEFFFKHSEKISMSEIFTLTAEEMLAQKDCSTQKEVAFSMLVKFLDDIEVQRIVCAILLLNKGQPADNEHEVLVNLVQLIAERKIPLADSRAYESVSAIFHILDVSVIQDEIFDKILSIWEKSVFADEVILIKTNKFDSTFAFSKFHVIALSVNSPIQGLSRSTPPRRANALSPQRVYPSRRTIHL